MFTCVNKRYFKWMYLCVWYVLLKVSRTTSMAFHIYSYVFCFFLRRTRKTMDKCLVVCLECVCPFFFFCFTCKQNIMSICTSWAFILHKISIILWKNSHVWRQSKVEEDSCSIACELDHPNINFNIITFQTFFNVPYQIPSNLSFTSYTIP